MDKEITASIRMQMLPEAPTRDQLISLFNKAHGQPGTLVHIPWIDEASKTPYSLSLSFSLKGGDPEWTLKRGLGTHATTVFVHRSGDVGLIHGLLDAPTATTMVPMEQSEPKQQMPQLQVSGTKRAGDVTARIMQETSGVYKQIKVGRTDVKAPEIARAKSKEVDDNLVFGHNILIGDLLLHAGFVTQAQLNQAIPMARKTGLPVARILEESGLLRPSIVQAAVLAQGLIRDKLLHLKLGTKALELVGQHDISLTDALKQLGWRSEYYEVANKLGQLLIEASVIDEEQLKIAFEVCFATGLPLGRVLVLRKMIPEVVAYTALSAQVFLRDGQITRESAVSAIRDAGYKNCTIQGSITANKASTAKVRLGELLVLAGAVSDVDLVSAIEAGLSMSCMIGQVLIRAGKISEPLLELALKIQEEANAGKCSIYEAAERLRTGKIEELNMPQTPVLVKSSSMARGDETVDAAFQALAKADNKELKKVLEQVLMERENLAFRLVSEHEEIKNRLARELHDTIIADLMMLKRYLSGDKQLTVKETIDIVDDVVKQLRDICNDFVPKHLQEWGLKTTLQDLVERVSMRTGIKCTFECEPDLKNLPEAVHLHIFRIIQECFNNIEKYANASRVDLKVECTKQKNLLFTVQDNGQGFDSDTPRTKSLTTDGGRGLHGMQERVQLIRCYMPTTLDVTSAPGKGSKVTLEIKTGSQ